MFLKLILFSISVSSIIGGDNFESCGISPSLERYKIYNPNRSFGGEEASEGDWPWIVWVDTNIGCTGSIISNKWILTAAHCFSSNDSNVKVYYGSVNQTLQKAVDAKNWIVHKDFELFIKNDVALIELSETLTFSKDVQPICLNGSILPNKNEILTAAGFGNNFKYLKCDDCEIGSESQFRIKKLSDKEKIASFTPFILNDTPLAYKTPETCISPSSGEIITRDEPFICTSGINHSVLPGDSGGPLMAIRENRWIQIGIITDIKVYSIPKERISMKAIGIFPRLNCKWIEENTDGQVSC